MPAQSVAKRGLLDVRDICDRDQLSGRGRVKEGRSVSLTAAEPGGLLKPQR